MANIRVSKKTYDLLKQRGVFGDSFEDIINKLLVIKTDKNNSRRHRIGKDA
jgi:hypothetical protein